jgi:hypothetical protein
MLARYKHSDLFRWAAKNIEKSVGIKTEEMTAKLLHPK